MFFKFSHYNLINWVTFDQVGISRLIRQTDFKGRSDHLVIRGYANESNQNESNQNDSNVEFLF